MMEEPGAIGMDADWRLMGQERYLQGATLGWKPYARWSETWDHDHCAFCHAEFDTSPECDALRAGYAVAAHTVSGRQFPDDYHWICPDCYQDFKARFRWIVASAFVCRRAAGRYPSRHSG